jgi:anaerobic ribonucleoside-triphosphate reductase
MATKNDTHCPICHRQASKTAKNNYMLCNQHGWFDPGLVYVDIQRAAPSKVTALSINN